MTSRLSREEFTTALYNFMAKRKTPIQRVPMMGLERVKQEKLLGAVARTLKIPESVTSSAFALRLHYTHLLYAFEMKQLHDIVVPVSETPTPAMQIKRDRRLPHTQQSGRSSGRSSGRQGRGRKRRSAWSDSESEQSSDSDNNSSNNDDDNNDNSVAVTHRRDATEAAAASDGSSDSDRDSGGGGGGGGNGDGPGGYSSAEDEPAYMAPSDRAELGLRPVERRSYREARDDDKPGGGSRHSLMEDVVTRSGREEFLAVRWAGMMYDTPSLQERMALGDLTSDARVGTYLGIRNFILKLWQQRITQHLSLAPVLEKLTRFFDDADIRAVYRYLNMAGFINFGVLRTVAPLYVNPTRKLVVVLGAGFAGLSAARQLEQLGMDAVVVEARARVGGRVYSDWRFGPPIDLGASIITGTEGNPIVALCRQLGVDLHELRDVCPIYNPDGSAVDPALDERVELHFNLQLEKSKQIAATRPDLSLGAVLDQLQQSASVGHSTDERRLLHWHLANLEFANASQLHQISAQQWDQDDEYAFVGPHCMVRQGYSRVAQGLASGLCVRFNSAAKEVRYSSTEAQVQLHSGDVLSAHAVVCALPLGVLKGQRHESAVRFTPPLPDWKQESIQRLGFGLLNKVAIQFSEAFWDPDKEFFGCTHDDPARRGEFYWFWNLKRINGVNALMALVSGASAEMIETATADEIVPRIMDVLRNIFGSIPPPIRAIATRWRSDPFACGSYSFIPPGASGNDYDAMSRAASPTLFFAGEATIRQYPATVHGAYLSGLRAAEAVAYTLLHNDDFDRIPGRPALFQGS